ncbi:MAG: ATP-binding protein [bacterium]
MSNHDANNWYEANQHYLKAALDEISQILERHIESSQSAKKKRASSPFDANFQVSWSPELPAPPALETLTKTFNLTAFERRLLLLCAGVDLDAKLELQCGKLNGDFTRSNPTFSLALSVLPEPHWSALSPSAPLRYWRLIEVGSGASLTRSTLKIDERILNYLAGVYHVDERLSGYLDVVDPPKELVTSHQYLAEQIAAIWTNSSPRNDLPVIQLVGTEAAEKRMVAASACKMVGVQMLALPAHFLPADQNEFNALIRLLLREGYLNAQALFLDCDDLDKMDSQRVKLTHRLTESMQGRLMMSSRNPVETRSRNAVSFTVNKPTTEEQLGIWRENLGRAFPLLNGQFESLISQFSLNLNTIHSICAEVSGKINPAREPLDAKELGRQLWDTCRLQARPRLEDLAQFIEPLSSWDDLVLPEPAKQSLREIATHLRQRTKVYEKWGFAFKSKRGLGISALFAGASGTGKTMAAEVLANEFRLDLYRIDLSSVVSKYIGETEKNLRKVFDAAEDTGAILLFDEADALFGKRSEVKDSHDRYANIEVSYLLQRMEAYRGLAILTTNRKSAIDSAFLRRIRFIIEFPFPELQQRAEIWLRVFPERTPRENLEIQKLARLNIAGGNIRNVALNAAFLAAEQSEVVQMKHLLRAARSEYAKIEKSLTENEIKGWA